MDDLAILKAAYHMDDGIHFPDMGEELVSKAFAIGRRPAPDLQCLQIRWWQG